MYQIKSVSMKHVSNPNFLKEIYSYDVSNFAKFAMLNCFTIIVNYKPVNRFKINIALTDRYIVPFGK